jgi:hypothetical protein
MNRAHVHRTGSLIHVMRDTMMVRVVGVVATTSAVRLSVQRGRMGLAHGAGMRRCWHRQQCGRGGRRSSKSESLGERKFSRVWIHLGGERAHRRRMGDTIPTIFTNCTSVTTMFSTSTRGSAVGRVSGVPWCSWVPSGKQIGRMLVGR